MSFRLDTPSGRIALAIGVSLLLHGLVLWGPNVELPRFRSSLPPLEAKMEVLPAAPAHAKAKHKAPAPPKPKAEATPQTAPAEEPRLAASAVEAASSVIASEIAAASAPAADSLAENGVAADTFQRPSLPRRAQLIFAVNKGTSNFKIGEVMHSLEIDDGHYVLRSETETTGLAKLFKPYRITQFSSGNYSRQGLQPEQFFEERADKLTTQRNTAEFDHAARLVRFSHGGEVALPADAQDILSILYQFPPLAHTETVSIFVSNGRKIERYEFEVALHETVSTALGDLDTVHLSKMHQANEEGLEIWLAPAYRLFPVKMRIIERNGEVSGEIVITSIHAEFEEEPKQDVDY